MQVLQQIASEKQAAQQSDADLDNAEINAAQTVMAFFREAISAHSCDLALPELIPFFQTWILTFEQIEELRAAVQKELNKLTKEVIGSLTGWQFILEAISVA